MQKEAKRYIIAVLTTAMWITVLVTSLIVTGCDEGMNLVGPVVDNPTPDPGEQNPKTPTLTINTILPADDGSITVSGTSANLSAGETVTITLGDTTTATATTDATGAWSVTVPAAKAASLTAGTTTVKAASGKAADTSSFEHTPPPEPTVTIDTVMQADDGSVTVSGTSTAIPEGEEVTVVLGDEAVTVKTTTDSKGAWSVIVPAAEAAKIAAGSVAVRATAKGIAEDESSFEHTPQQQPTAKHGIVPTTEAERIQMDIIVSVLGYDDSTATKKEIKTFKFKYNHIISQYGSLFDMETDVGQETFQRFAEYEHKKWILAYSGDLGNEALVKQYYAEAYGHSIDFAKSLVHDVYLEEKPEDKNLLSIRWQTFSISMEYLLLQIANPDASDEELIELLRESIRAGNVSIAA